MEILELSYDQLDLKKRVIMPTSNSFSSRTKHTWYSFFNEECAKALKDYLADLKSKPGHNRLFSSGHDERDYLFVETQKRTGLKITPKSLRFWFANEMSRLGVQDRFIDAFQG